MMSKSVSWTEMERQFESFAGRVEIARQPDRCPARLSGDWYEIRDYYPNIGNTEEKET